MIDVVFPNGNEAEFISMAEKLGISLCFVYPFSKFKKVSGVLSGVVCTPEQATRVKADLVFVNGDVRNVVEQGKIDVIFDIEFTKNDRMNSRESGMNQVLAKLLKEKHSLYGISFNSILSNGRMYLGRVLQNILLANKYKFDVALCSFARDPLEMRSESDLKSVLVSLGMHNSLVSKSVGIDSLIKRKVRGPNYICEGVELVE